MKFGKQIRFVAVKQWYDNYIPYKDLKRLLKQYCSQVQQAEDLDPSLGAVDNTRIQCIDAFSNTVHEAINRVIAFYVDQYVEAENDIITMRQDLGEQLESDDPHNDEADKNLHKRIYSCLLDLYELRAFLQINQSGANKIMKKLARVFDDPSIRIQYRKTENDLFNNLPETTKLMSELEDLYVTLKREVSLFPDTKPRHEIVMELHQKVENALIWKQSTVLSRFETMTFRHNELALVQKPIKFIPIIVAVVLLLSCQIAQFSDGFGFRAQRCLGIVAYGAVLWATSAVPLWLTSLSVPLLGIICYIIPGDRETVGKYLLQNTISPTVWLTIGGFTISSALRETELDKRIATLALKHAAHNKRVFLLVLILLNAFIAMWISNITSTMIVVALVASTLKQIPTDSQYAKACLFAIAVGGNIGGMLTPLASPQNAVTVDNVNSVSRDNHLGISIGFADFFESSLPFGVVCAFLAWGCLLLKFKMDILAVPPLQDAKTDFGWRQIYVSIVSLATIGIWISLPFGGDEYFSDFGIVGFIPVILFYGSGVLPPSRIGDLPWNILFLLMGGNALSRLVQDSGLMKVINDLLEDMLGGMTMWTTVLVLNLCVLVIDFFLTHTVSSMITLPLVCNYAANTGHLVLYAMCCCMITTASQILPVSSFPNMCCVTMQDQNGNEYITSAEMIKWGIQITIVLLIATMSVYYGLAILCGF